MRYCNGRETILSLLDLNSDGSICVLLPHISVRVSCPKCLLQVAQLAVVPFVDSANSVDGLHGNIKGGVGQNNLEKIRGIILVVPGVALEHP